MHSVRLRDLPGVWPERAVTVDVEFIHQPVAFDSAGKRLPLIDPSGVGSRSLADHVADVLRRPDDGSLDFEADLLFAPMRELRARGELSHEFDTVVLQPLVWVTSGRVQSMQLELDPLDV